MADRIELRGLRAVGTHGALPEERARAQPFEVDLDIDADLRGPGRSDQLADTIDYGAVTEAVVAVLMGSHARLLEHLAERIAAAVLEVAGSAGAVAASAGGGAASAGAGPIGAGSMTVTVTVRKLRPPVPADLASAAVRITRP